MRVRKWWGKIANDVVAEVHRSKVELEFHIMPAQRNAERTISRPVIAELGSHLEFWELSEAIPSKL